MVNTPEVAIWTYKSYEHEDVRGWPCHKNNDTWGEPISMHKKRILRDIVSFVESCFYIYVPLDLMCKMHINKHVDMDVGDRDRDFFLSRKDVADIYARLSKGKYHLHQKYEISMNLWYQNHKHDIFSIKIPMVETSHL